MTRAEISKRMIPVIHSPPLVAPPSCRARLHALGEDPREVTLISEAHVQSDPTKRLVGIEYKLLRSLHPLMKQPLMRSASDRLPEGSAKMPGRQATGTGQLLQTEISRQVCPQHLLRPSLLPGCQTSLAVF